MQVAGKCIRARNLEMKPKMLQYKSHNSDFFHFHGCVIILEIMWQKRALYSNKEGKLYRKLMQLACSVI